MRNVPKWSHASFAARFLIMPDNFDILYINGLNKQLLFKLFPKESVHFKTLY